MRTYQEEIAATLVVCLVFVPFGDWLTALRAATPPDPAVAKQQVELFGVGTVVEVKLASGQKLKGSIGASEPKACRVVP